MPPPLSPRPPGPTLSFPRFSSPVSCLPVPLSAPRASRAFRRARHRPLGLGYRKIPIYDPYEHEHLENLQPPRPETRYYRPSKMLVAHLPAPVPAHGAGARVRRRAPGNIAICAPYKHGTLGNLPPAAAPGRFLSGTSPTAWHSWRPCRPAPQGDQGGHAHDHLDHLRFPLREPRTPPRRRPPTWNSIAHRR
jgi:hypothetical protein